MRLITQQINFICSYQTIRLEMTTVPSAGDNQSVASCWHSTVQVSWLLHLTVPSFDWPYQTTCQLIGLISNERTENQTNKKGKLARVVLVWIFAKLFSSVDSIHWRAGWKWLRSWHGHWHATLSKLFSCSMGRKTSHVFYLSLKKGK